jgi:uncharacterized protein
VALWPAALSSMWAYRDELTGARAWLVRFTIPSLAGGAVGALLLLFTPSRSFEAIVPFLVLGATLLFLLQRPLTHAFNRRRPWRYVNGGDPPPPAASFQLAQFLVGVYGGYFGAGIGILMLATLGAMGFDNIHRMNGLKNWGALCINAVAALLFAVSGIVDWPLALAMAAGGLVGGYVGARLAQRVGQTWVRRAVVAVGFAAFVWLLARR